MSAGQAGGLNTVSTNENYNKMLSRIEIETQSSLKEVNATALKNIRVQPGKQYSGQVTIGKIPDPNLSHEIKVIVKANGETHEFLLNQVEA